MIEVKIMSFNGQEVLVEYQSGFVYGFEGSFYDNDFWEVFVMMNFEIVEGFQVEVFDVEGNLFLIFYGYEQVIVIEGQVFDYGIEEFVMEFEFMIDFVMNDFGMYVMFMFVFFEGEIIYLDGYICEYGFDYDMEVLFFSLDQVNFD